MAALKDLMQTEEKETVDAALSKAGIRFLYLKGSVLKRIWGDSSFRYMGDADFLYEGDDAVLRRTLEGIGYKAEVFGSRVCSHHFVFHKDPWFVLEPHFALLDDEDPFASTLTDVFDRATPDHALPGRYLISEEDLYLHCLLHLRKHIAGRGIGVRSFLDFAFLLREYPDLPERERVKRVLSDAGLALFASRVLHVARLLSDPLLTPDAEDERELSTLFGVGLFGTVENAVNNRLQIERSRSRFPRVRYILKRVFPPLTAISCRRIGAPLSWIVYPFFWLRRLFMILFTRQRRVRATTTFRVVATDKKGGENAAPELRYFGLLPDKGKGVDRG